MDDRRIVFDVTARDESQLIGSGHHERAIVEMDRLARRLNEKRIGSFKFPSGRAEGS